MGGTEMSHSHTMSLKLAYSMERGWQKATHGNQLVQTFLGEILPKLCFYRISMEVNQVREKYYNLGCLNKNQ